LHASRQAPAAAPAGRLRLVRGGSTLGFYTADGPDGDFTLLHANEFGTEDLKNVRILGSTGWPGASLDVLVTDVSIPADGPAGAKAQGPQGATGVVVPGAVTGKPEGRPGPS